MIPYSKHYIGEDDIQAVIDVLRSSNLTQGPKIAEFEQAVADYVGVKYAVAVSHGTAALHLAAIITGVGPGKSLVTSPITFVASANAGLYVGAEVLFADIDPDTVNISPAAIKQVVQAHGNVQAIVPVHFSGLPCDMSAIKTIADETGAAVIEDAAHALGASYSDGTKVGCCSHSLMTIFSFHPVKSIATGEGGMITTNDEAVWHRLLKLRSHGINKGTDSLIYPEQTDKDGLQAQWYYEMQELGYNYRITDIQCALGMAQLSKINKFISRRRELVKRYDQEFLNEPNCRPAQMVGRGQSAHHLYVLRVDFEKIGMSRQRFMDSLRKKGVGTQVHYIPVPLHPIYRQLGNEADKYKNAMEYYNEAISIPLYYSLQDDEQTHVIASIKKLLR
jgi:UDP-4-amino-4,6-dideoxy-N-acetyl-beta-L-altrosamine transaminase